MAPLPGDPQPATTNDLLVAQVRDELRVTNDLLGGIHRLLVGELDDGAPEVQSLGPVELTEPALVAAGGEADEILAEPAVAKKAPAKKRAPRKAKA